MRLSTDGGLRPLKRIESVLDGPTDCGIVFRPVLARQISEARANV